MVRPPTFDSNGMKKGAWSEEEDNKLRAFVQRFGHSNWKLLPKFAGLARCGKSCRLRWVNYLKPDLKRGNFTKNEVNLIIKLHDELGNKWSAIAAHFPGRTDNEIKNYWHAHINKRNKRKSAVTEAIRYQNISEQHQSSSEINCSPTTDHHQEELPASENVLPLGLSAEKYVGDSYSFAEAEANPWIEQNQTCFDQFNINLPPFPDEELHEFGLCPNHMSNFTDFSDGGNTSWNSTAESQASFWSEPFGEDTVDMVLWQWQ